MANGAACSFARMTPKASPICPPAAGSTASCPQLRSGAYRLAKGDPVLLDLRQVLRRRTGYWDQFEAAETAPQALPTFMTLMQRKRPEICNSRQRRGAILRART